MPAKIKKKQNPAMRVQLFIPEVFKEMLMTDAKARGMQVTTFLLACWIEQLPREARERARALMPKKHREIDQPVPEGKARCVECLAVHERIPEPGPWHSVTCGDYRPRGLL